MTQPKGLRLPKGRQTIRTSGGRRTRLWELGGSANPTVQRLEAAYLAGLAAIDRAEARHAASKADPRFTPDGVRDDLLKFVLSDAVPALHRGRTAVKKARAEVAERRSKLKIAEPDKSDVAGAFRRMEIRTFLREMGDEQTKYFASHGDNVPVEVAMAIMEMAPEFSGVPKSRHDLLTERALDAQFGDAIEEIKEIEQAIEAAESAVEAARDEVRLEVGMHDVTRFNELAAPIEAKHDAPWLRRQKKSDGTEEINVVDLDQKVERPAAPEEIENGIEYRNYDAFMEGKSA